MRWRQWVGSIGALLVAVGMKLSGGANTHARQALKAETCTHVGGSRFRNSGDKQWRCGTCGEPLEVILPPVMEKVRGDWIDPIDLDPRVW